MPKAPSVRHVGSPGCQPRVDETGTNHLTAMGCPPKEEHPSLAGPYNGNMRVECLPFRPEPDRKAPQQRERSEQLTNDRERSEQMTNDRERSEQMTYDRERSEQ